MTEWEREETDFDAEASKEEALDEIISMLVEMGALALSGQSEDGEPIYKVTPECQEIFPDFYELHQSDVNTTLNSLWQLGIVEVEFDENGEKVRMTERNEKNYYRMKEELTDKQIEVVEILLNK